MGNNRHYAFRLLLCYQNAMQPIHITTVFMGCPAGTAFTLYTLYLQVHNFRIKEKPET